MVDETEFDIMDQEERDDSEEENECWVCGEDKDYCGHDFDDE
jgi:hypothetical protein